LKVPSHYIWDSRRAGTVAPEETAASNESDATYRSSKDTGIASAKLKYHDAVEVTIDDISFEGLGVGRYKTKDDVSAGIVVMVPFTIPGEVVRARIFRVHKTYCEADLLEVLSKSPDRVKPPCKYFGVCGGCQFQHISLQRQRRIKEDLVRSLFARIGGLGNVSIDAIMATDEAFNYRTKLTPQYTSLDRHGNFSVGFQEHSRRSIVDVQECMIATEDVNKAYAQARDELFCSGSLDGKPLLNSKKAGSLNIRESYGEEVVMNYTSLVTAMVGNLTFRFPAGSFFQNNKYILKPLVDYVLSEASAGGCSSFVDTYCGSGLFAISASNRFSRVIGVEIDEQAVQCAQSNAELNGITNARFICSTSSKIFGQLENFPANDTVVVIDPPRKGCDESFLSQLFAYGPSRLVYVSCDPSTQARDARVIVDNGYEISRITPFDLFPQTRHVENVVTFIKSTS
jgi:23S rRNA (uracil1939-C5)-methyltransferase/tRNA (uracil-5-)-methyltransferase